MHTFDQTTATHVQYRNLPLAATRHQNAPLSKVNTGRQISDTHISDRTLERACDTDHSGREDTVKSGKRTIGPVIYQFPLLAAPSDSSCFAMPKISRVNSHFRILWAKKLTIVRGTSNLDQNDMGYQCTINV